ncbi:MAG: carrier protein [Hydrocarboniphaga sp.]|uniref:Npt1/Npt2 family nucleotide transporter n=1 Tax=Hydrocarboniphaga sp. TaxID=2033016 RepID=UPI002614D963|nr:Npt1/Npt2 family nucleotide transporter [Hydrocarboniphaga sp.]MDB5970820.1 carrier protein [Hydrocarboniphaga sp.]
MNSSPVAKRLSWTGSTALRSLLLFLNFFLILLAYYLVKPASRSLFLSHLSSDMLPYVWTGSGLLLLLLVPGYQKLLKRYGRLRVVLGSCAGTSVLLLLFRGLFHYANAPIAFGFYILVDIFSVVLVEQFWSLTNSVYNSREGKRWYGLIASGGLVGGIAGGMVSSALVKYTSLNTEDLISVAAVLVLAMMALTGRLARAGVYREREVADAPVHLDEPSIDFGVVLKSIRSNRFVALIALLVLFSQICEPIVEYQFMHHVEAAYANGEARTVFLSQFLSLQSGVALAVNLLLTPLIHRYGGVIAGLLMQPLLLGVSAMAYLFNTDLRTAAVMKISDRGLSYSINRSSRELLYVGADAHTIFKVKAWIDMVGYRVFKIVGNVAILLIVQWTTYQQSETALSAVVVMLCVGWGLCVVALRRVGGAAGKAPMAPVIQGTAA